MRCSFKCFLVILILFLAVGGGGIYFFSFNPHNLEEQSDEALMIATNPRTAISPATRVGRLVPPPFLAIQKDDKLEDPLLLFHRSMSLSPFFLVNYPEEALAKLTKFELSQVAEEEVLRLSEEFENFYQVSPSPGQLIDFFRYQSQNRLELIKGQVGDLQQLQDQLQQAQARGEVGEITRLQQEQQRQLEELRLLINYENGIIGRTHREFGSPPNRNFFGDRN